MGCFNPGSDRPKSLKQVVTVPLPNALYLCKWTSGVLRMRLWGNKSQYWCYVIKDLHFSTSTDHRTTNPAPTIVTSSYVKVFERAKNNKHTNIQTNKLTKFVFILSFKSITLSCKRQIKIERQLKIEKKLISKLWI